MHNPHKPPEPPQCCNSTSDLFHILQNSNCSFFWANLGLLSKTWDKKKRAIAHSHHPDNAGTKLFQKINQMLLGTIYTILLLYLVSGFIFRFVSVVKQHWILPDSAETQLLEKFQKFSSTFPQTSPQRKKIFYHVFVTHNSGTSPEASQVNGGHVLEPGPTPALLEHHQLARHPPTDQSQQRWTFWNQNQPSDRTLLCDLKAYSTD